MKDNFLKNIKNIYEQLCIYIFVFFVFSILGWVWEVLLYLYSSRHFYNAGTLFGPYLPIYGIVAVLVYLICEELKSNIAIFLFTIIIIGPLEYTTSFILELIYHKRWWDYSNLLLNINGRVCVEALIFFGAIAVIANKYIFKYIDKIYFKIKGRFLNLFLVIISTIFIIDFMICIRHPNDDIINNTFISFKSFWMR